MDRVTEGLLNDFVRDFQLDKKNKSSQFEYFVNYSVISKENGPEYIDLEDLQTGEATQGLDGLAIIVNRKIVNSIEEINELIRINKSLDVKFVLIQSKIAENFDNSEISNMFNFTNLFFNNSDIFTNSEMKKFMELKDHIYFNASKLKNNPELVLYYVTTGSWLGDQTLTAVINAQIDILEKTNLFSTVRMIPCGAIEIQTMYRKTNSELITTFNFEKRCTMYSINENELGYCGVIPFKEYKKIIMDEDKNLKPVFEDNIRDYLGENPDVNCAIKETALNGNNNAFSQLNNGVVVVANSSKLSGDIMTLKDYQIVNGCQTSHVLYQNMRNCNLENLMIPIRIIITEDENLKNSITKATNNQTAIKKEQLEALSTFQKSLEDYYKTYTNDNETLYYERRTGQYRNSGVVKAKIISIPTQIKTVTAMFLNNPSGVSGQYGTIAKNVGNKIFKKSDRPVVYYTSSLALYRIESLLKSNEIDKKYWRTRYHAIMILRMKIAGKEVPKFNAKKIEAYCKKILTVLNDNENCKNYFDKIISFIVSRDYIDLNDRKQFERKETTDNLIRDIDELKI